MPTSSLSRPTPRESEYDEDESWLETAVTVAGATMAAIVASTIGLVMYLA